MKKSNIHLCTTALSLVLLLSVAACKPPETSKGLDSLMGNSAAVEERLSTAAVNAIAEGKTDEALALYERLYTRDRSPDSTLNYAQLLRKTGKAQRALTVLEPFVKGWNGKKIDADAAPILLNEYAASNIEIGNFEKADEALNMVLKNKDAISFHADALNLLGISQATQGQHKQAEQSFRKSLEGWKGDSTSVMNNLAVCLASQGMFDESLMTLRQALMKAPDKQEIAQNIQLVSELRQSFVQKPGALKSSKKHS